jgi:hypothetical protein
VPVLLAPPPCANAGAANDNVTSKAITAFIKRLMLSSSCRGRIDVQSFETARK